MKCFYCRKTIGPLRRLTDSQFCSADHRKKARASSARFARDNSYTYGDEDVWPEMHESSERKSRLVSNQRTQAGVVFAIAVSLVFVLVFSWVSGPAPIRNAATTNLFGALEDKSTGLGQALRSSIPSRGAVRLQDDFRTGLEGWLPSSGRALDWKVESGIVHPGKLALWKPSLNLVNYRMDFQGQIEKKSMAWAFRATDLKNYYATKITLRKAGRQPAADIVRYAVMNGKELERVQLPLPMVVRDDMLYRVQVNIKGDRFSTMINGQLVDTWADKRIPSGGVGFFADKGEVAALHWVKVSEESQSLLGRIFALGFFMPPVYEPPDSY